MKNNDIVRAFAEAANAMENAAIKLETFYRTGQEILASEQCKEIDEELIVINTWLARAWIPLGELKKKAPPSVAQQLSAEAQVGKD